MSRYRNLGGGKRDDNEPLIISRFALHDWHAEKISGNRLWDLIVFHRGNRFRPTPAGTVVSLVDVKQPGGEVTKAQADYWEKLYALGIIIYVVRTEADVDALVAGALEPWRPEETGSIRAPRAHGDDRRPRKGDAAKVRKGRKVDVNEAMAARRTSENYTPPRSERVVHNERCLVVELKDPREPCTCDAEDAAKEAEAFAPGPPVCRRCGCQIRAMDAGMCNTCLEDQRILGQP